ncbi:hypothetical protein EPI10_015611 [Gossypium australe]|uniref:Uncharacterized protein n=1 Tax=Gossypium australe TaxID=47621 RepID=A0A5B6VKT4_9ROSI|nr:hypothetical protein EPI10_015611 [Gossypium australe]
MEDRYKWLEEKFNALKSADYQCGMDAKELSLVSDLVLPPKFKMPEFEKYNRTSCPEAHITMFCRRMTGHVNSDQLLIHYLAQTFMKQYGYVKDIAPDRITLQNMEKKSNESFRQYAQRERNKVRKNIGWGKHQEVSPEKERKRGWQCERGYAKPITVNQPRAVTTGQQASPRQEPNTKQNAEKLQFTPIPMTYWKIYKRILGHSIENCFSFKRLFERLIKADVVKFDDAPSVGNPLPSHTNKGVNAIVENAGKRIKLNVAEIRTLLREVWKRMVERGLVMQDVEGKSREARN